MPSIKDYLLKNGAQLVQVQSQQLLQQAYQCPAPALAEWYADKLSGSYQCVGCPRMCMSFKAAHFQP